MKNKKDGNSSINQKIKGRFIEREVYCCFSYEMDAILKAGVKDLPTWDDIENVYYLNNDNIIYSIMPDYESKKAEFQEYSNNPDTFNRRVKTKGDSEVFLYSLNDDELREFCEEFGYDCEEEPQEIFEWWIVSEWFYNKLKEKGEPVMAWGNNHYWGRCTTGQAILLDSVITGICKEMEILEGQKNEWEVK